MQYIKDKKNSSLYSAIYIYIYLVAATLVCLIIPSENRKTTIFYCLIILSATIFVALAQGTRNKVLFKIFISISFFILFFIFAYRNFSAIDDLSYVRIFNNVNINGLLEHFKNTKLELGYLLLNKIILLFTDNYLFMQLISSFIPLFLFYYAFVKNRNNINLSMAVFLFITLIYFKMLSTGLVRMFISMGIVINSYKYIYEKNNKKFIILILIASLFHYSALFMFILEYFFISKRDIKKKSNSFIVLVLFAIPIGFMFISKVLVPILGSRYIKYGIIGKFTLSLSSFDTLPILILLIIYGKKVKDENKNKYKLFISIFSLSSIISFYSGMVPVGRLVFYTNIALFLVAPMISQSMKNNKDRIIFDAIMILYGFVYVYFTQFTLNEYIPRLFPYQNIFFNM